MPRIATPLLYGLSALLLVLDVVVYAGPLVIRGQTGTDTAPTFAVTAQTTPTPGIPAATVAAAPITRQACSTTGQASGGDTVAGTAILGMTNNGTPVLRLENLQSANGPDL
jgi:hypothetical protein